MTDREFLLKLLAHPQTKELTHDQLTELFKLENNTELIKAYVKKHPFGPWDNTQMLLFDRPDSPELILFYIKKGYGFNPELEYKLYELPNATEVISEYIKKHELYSNLAQLKLFAFPNAADILKSYIENRHKLGAKAQLKLFDLPNAEAMVKLYSALNFELSKDFKRLMHKNGWHKH